MRLVVNIISILGDEKRAGGGLQEVQSGARSFTGGGDGGKVGWRGFVLAYGGVTPAMHVRAARLRIREYPLPAGTDLPT